MKVWWLIVGALGLLLEGWLSAQTICPPHIRWQATFGAGGLDEGTRILQLADGGFVVGGYSGEPWDGSTQGNKTAPNYGGPDFYIVRLDSQGQKLWDRSYGTAQSETLAALEQTADGGLMLAGTSSTNFGDFWIVRTDAAGNKLWDRYFNRGGQDVLGDAKQTSDGGFILAGSTQPNYAVPMDFWIIRLDANGNKLWDATYGGNREDFLTAIQQTPDGGFLLGGRSISDTSGSKSAPFFGSYDYWLVRVDDTGGQLWDRAYGGTQADLLESVLIAPNGDILLAGYSTSGIDGNKTNISVGAQDFWVLRLNPDGESLWQHSYGGDNTDYLRRAALVGTNGFVLCGSSYSAPGGSKTAQYFYVEDCWAVRIDANGNQIWDASFGTTGYDHANDIIPTADGGYALIAVSDQVNGNKTSPSFGSYDFWVIKLNPENPEDCDDDGVPNARDLCGGTPFGALINSNGCAIEQICPCQDWPGHADYIACVERTTAEFESAGLITSERRAQLLAEAQRANCPPGLIQFGLEHVLLKDTIATDQGYLTFQPGTNTFWGATVLLGEADSGIFIDPWAGGWGNYDPNWFLDGKAYGRFADGSNGLIVTLHATKPALEYYPVEIDFSPLGPTNITVQQIDIDNGTVVSEEDIPGSIGYIGVNSSINLNPRVNPFWRMPDGSVGALFEFYPYPPDRYNTVFVRPNGVTRNVDYVSRVEAIGSGGYYSFSFNDERLGKFGNRHHILNNGRFHAEAGQLSVTPGATVEFYNTAHFEADFLPIDVATSEGVLLTASHGGFLEINWLSNTLVLQAAFSGPSTGATDDPPAVVSVEIKAFRNGILSGSCVAENNSTIGYLTASNEAPRIVGCIASASSNSPPAIAFSVDRLATFNCTNGSALVGTHFQISAVDPQFVSELVSNLNVVVAPSGFTITGERSATAQPRLSISANDDTVILTWPDKTRLFRLESSPTLPGGFATVPTEPDFISNQNQLTLPRDRTGSRFFRLRSGPD